MDIKVEEEMNDTPKDSEETINNTINELINTNKVVVFSKIKCPFCIKAKNMLAEKQIEFKSFNIDESNNMTGYAIALTQRSGSKTVPQIQINQKFVGGFTELDKLFYGDSNPKKDLDI